MMYKNDFVAVLKTNGKILREDGSTIYVPFGSEYSILLKNLRAVKATVSVSIDGTDVLNGARLIVNPNSSIELERFLEDLDKGNRFKFIQKTEKIQEHRGDKIDDGIIRIEFQYEKPYEVMPINNIWSGGKIGKDVSFPKGFSHKYSDNTLYKGSSAPRGVLRSASLSPSSVDAPMMSFNSAVQDSFAPLAEEGITVKGSESTQQFKAGTIGALESQKHVITLQLKGVSNSGTVVEQPVTVDTKKTCKTCGTVNKYTNKFCSECGTFLE